MAFSLRSRRAPYVAGTSALALLLLLSLGLRWRDFSREAGAPNADATYHTLLTLTALRESPAAAHRWLPTVSLGGALDKNVSWGGAIPTPTGDYVYTSFPPLGFLAPYFSLTALNVAPAVRTIAYFNFLLGALCTFVLFVLLVRVLSLNGADPWVSISGALVASTISIFSREALLSHGLNYWSQSLYQPVLALSLYFFLRYLTEGRRNVLGVALVVTAFVGAMIEWSGYLFAAGLAALVWFESRDRVSSRRLALMILLSAAAAGILTAVHFGSVLGFSDALNGMFDRAEARSASHGSGRALLRGYLASYGLFLAVVAGALAVVFGKRKESPDAPSGRVILIVLTAASIPLLENVILLEHAGRYSFDRLKFAFPAALVVALSFPMISARWRVITAAAVCAASVHGVLSYRAELRGYASWDVVAAENRVLAERVGREVDLRCAVLTTNQDVRGYTTLLFHRGVHEMSSLQQTDSLRSARGACGSVHLESVWAFPELRDFRKATITRRDGSVAVLEKP